MQQTVQIPQNLYDAVRKQAQSQHKTTDDLIVEWVSEKINKTKTNEAQKAFKQEIAAFEKMKPELLQRYPGQYVAIYQGQVVATGNNRLSLVKEVYDQFGEAPCYVEKVSPKPARRVRIPPVWKHDQPVQN